MPNVHNMSLTAAIDVLFSVNFAVVFDFMYFRFRPSKAKSIGNVLPNRQNAAKRAQEICWRIKDGYTCTVTRRSAEFRHPARMTQDSSCYIGENDWFIWAGNLHPQVPKFSAITGNFRRFSLWKKEEDAWWDRTQYLWITIPVLYP